MLSPFIRSDAQGSILAELFLHPETEVTIRELARRADVLPAVAHRELTRLLDAGVLTDRRQGNNRLIRVNQDHPLYTPMAWIIEETYGVVPALRDSLSGVTGINEAFVYGSWAARRAGEKGTPPRDIDVMVIGEASHSDLYDAAAAVQARIRREINIRRTHPEDWVNATIDPFLSTVKSRPMIPISLPPMGAADGT